MPFEAKKRKRASKVLLRSATIVLREREDGYLKRAMYVNCDAENENERNIKGENTKRTSEHVFSARSNVRKGSNQIKALQTLKWYIIYNSSPEFIFDKKSSSF